MNRADLIDRLEKLTGPCREVDAEIALHFGARHRSRRTGSGVNKGREWFVDSIGGVEGWSRHPPARTASIDAAVALSKAKVPGWRLRIEFGDNYSIAQFVRGWGGRKEIFGVATSERADDEICLAICEATLRALEGGSDAR